MPNSQPPPRYSLLGKPESTTLVKCVGKYQLLQIIGKGMFAQVYKSIDTGTNEFFAVKVVPKSKLMQQDPSGCMLWKLRREVEIMRHLRHENVIQLRECLQTQNNVYLVTELAEGGELLSLITKAKSLPEKCARLYFHQLILGIMYCHRMGIAHRDIKPQNILLSADGRLKVTDFGFSRSNSETLHTVCGTPYYVAPEVLDGAYDGFQADVWSCGVVLFVMVAGDYPFPGKTRPELFQRIRSGRFTAPAHFSDGLTDLISHMLNVDTARRATIADIINHPWFKVDMDVAKFDVVRQVIGTDTIVAFEHHLGALSPRANPPKPQACRQLCRLRSLSCGGFARRLASEAVVADVLSPTSSSGSTLGSRERRLSADPTPLEVAARAAKREACTFVSECPNDAARSSMMPPSATLTATTTTGGFLSVNADGGTAGYTYPPALPAPNGTHSSSPACKSYMLTEVPIMTTSYDLPAASQRAKPTIPSRETESKAADATAADGLTPDPGLNQRIKCKLSLSISVADPSSSLKSSSDEDSSYTSSSSATDDCKDDSVVQNNTRLPNRDQLDASVVMRPVVVTPSRTDCWQEEPPPPDGHAAEDPQPPPDPPVFPSPPSTLPPPSLSPRSNRARSISLSTRASLPTASAISITRRLSLVTAHSSVRRSSVDVLPSRPMSAESSKSSHSGGNNNSNEGSSNVVGATVEMSVMARPQFGRSASSDSVGLRQRHAESTAPHPPATSKTMTAVSPRLSKLAATNRTPSLVGGSGLTIASMAISNGTSVPIANNVHHGGPSTPNSVTAANVGGGALIAAVGGTFTDPTVPAPSSRRQVRPPHPQLSSFGSASPTAARAAIGISPLAALQVPISTTFTPSSPTLYPPPAQSPAMSTRVKSSSLPPKLCVPLLEPILSSSPLRVERRCFANGMDPCHALGQQHGSFDKPYDRSPSSAASPQSDRFRHRQLAAMDETVFTTIAGPPEELTEGSPVSPSATVNTAQLERVPSLPLQPVLMTTSRVSPMIRPFRHSLPARSISPSLFQQVDLEGLEFLENTLKIDSPDVISPTVSRKAWLAFPLGEGLVSSSEVDIKEDSQGRRGSFASRWLRDSMPSPLCTPSGGVGVVVVDGSDNVSDAGASPPATATTSWDGLDCQVTKSVRMQHTTSVPELDDSLGSQHKPSPDKVTPVGLPPRPTRLVLRALPQLPVRDTRRGTWAAPLVAESSMSNGNLTVASSLPNRRGTWDAAGLLTMNNNNFCDPSLDSGSMMRTNSIMSTGATSPVPNNVPANPHGDLEVQVQAAASRVRSALHRRLSIQSYNGEMESPAESPSAEALNSPNGFDGHHILRLNCRSRRDFLHNVGLNNTVSSVSSDLSISVKPGGHAIVPINAKLDSSPLQSPSDDSSPYSKRFPEYRFPVSDKDHRGRLNCLTHPSASPPSFLSDRDCSSNRMAIPRLSLT